MKFLLIIAMMVIAWKSVLAQQTPSEMAKGQAAELTKKLSLTDGQRDSVVRICEIYHRKMAGLRAQRQLSQEELGKIMRLYDYEWNIGLQRVLNTGQYRQFLEDKEQLRRKADSLRVGHFKHEGH